MNIGMLGSTSNPDFHIPPNLRIALAAAGGGLLYGALGRSWNNVLLGVMLGGVIGYFRGYVKEGWPFGTA